MESSHDVSEVVDNNGDNKGDQMMVGDCQYICWYKMAGKMVVMMVFHIRKMVEIIETMLVVGDLGKHDILIKKIIVMLKIQ